MEQPHTQPVKGLFRLCPWFPPRDVLVDVILLQVALLELRVSVAPPTEGHLPVQYDTYIYRACIRRLGAPVIQTEDSNSATTSQLNRSDQNLILIVESVCSKINSGGELKLRKI